MNRNLTFKSTPFFCFHMGPISLMIFQSGQEVMSLAWASAPGGLGRFSGMLDDSARYIVALFFVLNGFQEGGLESTSGHMFYTESKIEQIFAPTLYLFYLHWALATSLLYATRKEPGPIGSICSLRVACLLLQKCAVTSPFKQHFLLSMTCIGMLKVREF